MTTAVPTKKKRNMHGSILPTFCRRTVIARNLLVLSISRRDFRQASEETIRKYDSPTGLGSCVSCMIWVILVGTSSASQQV
mmetsp:Transcript_9986/g.16077  ORF Transcript_9986/g.16077 Transcript_9986/m.16077 type:complete len:81 (+) Transcript_9986:1025-1267(+)